MILCLFSNLLIIAFAAHKYSQAIDLYSQAIELNNDNAVYWANRAFAHTKLEEYGSAIQDATSAIEIDPKYSKASSVGLCFLFGGKEKLLVLSCGIGEGKQQCGFLELIVFFSMQGYYRRGAAYLAMGKFKEALKDFQQVGFLRVFYFVC